MAQNIFHTMLIGRQLEISALQECSRSDRSELVAVYGRRRIGKTFLVKETFHDRFTFTYVGIRNQSTKQQLAQFAVALQMQSQSVIRPTFNNWYEAFHALESFLAHSRTKKKIVFIDEMPWLDNHRSNFVSALEGFWNGWASLRNDILLIICGSSTSWMVDKIFHNKGGLFNRVTRHIYLRPFTLSEVEQYLDAKSFNWDRYQIAQCYMILGGVPHYLSLLDRSKSLSQNIDQLFFNGPNAPLRMEYDELFTSLFNHPDNYARIIDLLCRHREGLSRKQLSELGELGGAGLTKTLLNLERSDFIFGYSRYGSKSNNVIYRIKDFYSLFYHKFASSRDTKDPNRWSHLLNSPQVSSWQGLSFELLCIQHLEQIKCALGIQVMLNESSVWRSKDADHPAQIDLVIERADRVINLCEIKFTQDRFVIDKKYGQWLSDRRALFVAQSKTKMSTIITMITTFGILPNKQSHIVSSEVTLDQLFN